MTRVQNVILILALVCAPMRCVALSYTPYGGMSEAPMIQMQSTSVWASQRSDMQATRTQGSGGFYTSASAVRGGVTTYDTYNPAEDGCRVNAPRRMPGVPDIFPTPIGDGWEVWLFMAILAAGYGFVKERRNKSEELRAKIELL